MQHAPLVRGSEQVEWDDLRGKLAAECALGLMLCGWIAGWYLLDRPNAGLMLVLLAMALIGLGAWLWSRSTSHPQQSALLLTAITFGSVCIAWYSLQLPALVYVFAIPVMLAALLLRSWTTLVVGAGVWLVVYGPLAPSVMVDSSASALLILLCAFQVTVMRAVRKHLTQTQRYQAHAVTLVEKARMHQEEVKRLNKSLGLAYSLLRRRTQELATARQEAENALRMKEQFAVYVSHELRTPLNIMLGFLEILQRYPEVYGDVQWTPTLRRDIGEIQRSARHLFDLVNDLLDLARIDAVKMPIHRESCRLEDVLSEAMDLMGRLLVQKPVQLRLTIDGTLPTLYIDRTRIRQVFLNLLANASRFTHVGEIHLHAAPRVDEIIIAVRDTGIGIAPDQLLLLFDDYSQVAQPGQTTGQTNNGKGLGLAIAKRFVQMHGGRIWAESQVGKGSTFFVAIPMTTVQVAPAVRHSHIAPIPEMQQHLLVIDPDPAAAAYLRRQLDSFRVTPVVDLEEARRFVLEQRPDAVIYNVPPDLSEAGREIGLTTPSPILPEGVPLIQCTLPVGSWLLQGDYFDGWLVKPVESRKLLQLLDRYCPPHGKILLADDDRSFVQLVQRILQAAGCSYRLDWAYSLEEGMAKVAGASPDLMLVDIALAGSDGRRLAQYLRQREAQHEWANGARTEESGESTIPIVAISSFAPGIHGNSMRSCSFGLTRKEGFSESELLELIVQSARQVRPRYAPWSNDAILALETNGNGA
ncbi:MAG: response regulator [Caldilineaceae bacterium]|nr:response regulator [Caldilineaceae bacterium]